MARIGLDALEALARAALERAGASPPMAKTSAAVLAQADAQGLAGHGVARVPQYAAHLRNGRALGGAVPRIVRERGGAALVDAACGLAYPACALAVDEAVRRARAHGIAYVGVTNSHHSGASGLHLAPVARGGLIGMMFSNSPAAMPAWGGRTPLFGTNPIAAVFPRRGEDPLIVDLSLSEVARGRIMVAAKAGKPIPAGWALDRAGNPTTDPAAALEGSMLPAAGVKGAMLALVVELLCCALTGARFGFEADSFFTDEGNQPRIGQAFLVIDPDALVGEDAYHERLEILVGAMLADAAVRLPGERRLRLAARAALDGVEIPDPLLRQLEALAR